MEVANLHLYCNFLYFCEGLKTWQPTKWVSLCPIESSENGLTFQDFSLEIL